MKIEINKDFLVGISENSINLFTILSEILIGRLRKDISINKLIQLNIDKYIEIMGLPIDRKDEIKNQLKFNLNELYNVSIKLEEGNQFDCSRVCQLVGIIGDNIVFDFSDYIVECYIKLIDDRDINR